MRRGLAFALLCLAPPVLLAQVPVPGQVVPGQGSRDKSHWEEEQERKNFQEGNVAPPAYYKEADLMEFKAGNITAFRYYIDKASIAVGDGMVRYTMVARSSQGAENVVYEGVRCDAGLHRTFAFGQRDGSWKPVHQQWAPGQQQWVLELRRNFFCPQRRAINSVAEGIDALRRGQHPDSVNLGR